MSGEDFQLLKSTPYWIPRNQIFRYFKYKNLITFDDLWIATVTRMKNKLLLTIAVRFLGGASKKKKSIFLARTTVCRLFPCQKTIICLITCHTTKYRRTSKGVAVNEMIISQKKKIYSKLWHKLFLSIVGSNDRVERFKALDKPLSTDYFLFKEWHGQYNNT